MPVFQALDLKLCEGLCGPSRGPSTWATFCCSPSYISREVDQESNRDSKSTLIWYSVFAGGSLMCCATMLVSDV